MQAQRQQFTSPVGRIVMGSLYKPNTTDAEGKPLVVKNGPNAGQARSNFFFALAIPKAPGQTHWAQRPAELAADKPYWGELIWQVGHGAFPQAAQSPAFAWKIEDGDSQVPNKKGRKPCDNEGWAGHWILKYSGGFAPKVYRQDGASYVQVTETDYIKAGHFVEVAGTVDGNGSQSQPGIYLNHSMVCFRAYGPEIVFGPDVNEAGFGQSALPAGASMTPPPSSIPMPAAIPANTASVAAVPVPAPSATSASIPAIPVTPNPAFLQVPASAAAPLPAIPASLAASVAAPIPQPPAPASPSRTMTALAQGASYEAFIAAGWTEANLIAQGYMTA